MLEVDNGAVKKAFEALDAGKQQDKVNKLLTSLIGNPELNPAVANIWADRINLVTKWNLFSYLKKIPPNSRALETILQNVVLGSKKVGQPVRLVSKLVAKYPKATRKHTQVWAVIGQIFATGSRWSKTADWLKDWESRPDAQGWMVTNLVFSLQVLGRIKEADVISQKLLAKGLRDHTAAYHLVYLALSALERHEAGKARELLQAAHLESDHKSDTFFKLAVEQALLVQEAEPGSARQRVGSQARYRLSAVGLPALKVQRLLKAEARAALLMARDSKSFSAWTYAVRINTVARIGSPTSFFKNGYARVVLLIILINTLRMCSESH